MLLFLIFSYVLAASEKLIDEASCMTLVRLENFNGWLFESSDTGEVK